MLSARLATTHRHVEMKFATKATKRKFFWRTNFSEITSEKNIKDSSTRLKSIDYPRLQNSRFRTFSVGAKRRERDPRLWGARASLPILPRRFHTRSIPPCVRVLTVARVRKKYDCYAV